MTRGRTRDTGTHDVEPVALHAVGPLRVVQGTAWKLLLVAAFLLGVLAAAGHLLSASAAANFDASIDRTLAANRTPWLVTVTFWVTQAAQTTTVVAVAVIVIVSLLVISRRWQQPAFVAITLAGEVVIFLLITLLVHRARPDVQRLDPAPPTSSFPSGHTAAAVAMYWSLAVVVARTDWRTWLRRVVIAVLAVLPLVVAFSRLYRGMHYPTDVLGGLVLGSSWLFATTRIVWPGRA
jgi:membrane-associated phospholipid phosphatase